MNDPFIIILMVAASCFTCVFGYFCGCWQCRIRKVKAKDAGKEPLYYYIQENPLNQPVQYKFVWGELEVAVRRAAEDKTIFY